MTDTLSLDRWHESYLTPFTDDKLLQERIDDYGGFAGWVLDGIVALKDVDGQDATDHECLEIIQLLVGEYLDAVKRGVDTQ